MDRSWWRVLTKCGPREKGIGKPFQYSHLENPVNSMKRQNDRILKEELPRSVGVSNVLPEINREITPERMKRRSQSENSAQLWMRLAMEVKSNAIKSNITYEPGMLGP